MAKRHDAYRALLERVKDEITHERVVAAVAELEPELRAQLAEGPEPYRYDCAVCDVCMDPDTRKKRQEFDPDALDLNEPRNIIFLYHELPKLDARDTNQLHYGAPGVEINKRCIEIYRAAGWSGREVKQNG